MKLFARDNLCYQGNIIRKGDELPDGVPTELLDHWREQAAIAEVPVVEESDPVPADALTEDTDPKPAKKKAK